MILTIKIIFYFLLFLNLKKKFLKIYAKEILTESFRSELSGLEVGESVALFEIITCITLFSDHLEVLSYKQICHP